MIFISTDENKEHIFLELVNHGLWPYGTQTMSYAINGLGLEAESELLRIYANATGGEQAYCYVNDLYISGVKATMENVARLFKETCYSNNVSGGGGGSSTDMTEVVKALNNLNKTLRCNCGGQCCEYKETYLTLEEYNALSGQSPNIKYIIYCESGDCTYDEEDFDTNLDPSEEVCEENIDFNEKYMTIDEYNQSDKDGEIKYNIIES